jgi:glutamyl-tRNA reductase
MLRLGLVGVSIHNAPLELLSGLTIPREQRAERLRALAETCGFEELAYVATCNRVEFFFVTAEERAIHVSRNRLLDFFFSSGDKIHFQPENFYFSQGVEAARHLFTVASALDSLVIGEAQILGQVKDAFAEAEEAGLTGETLRRVFQAAFRCAKKVRRETEIGAKRVSMVNLAAAYIGEFMSGAEDCSVALVGVGPMTAKLAEMFRDHGVGKLYFVNRTVEKAGELAQQWNGMAVALDEFLAAPYAVDCICTATASTDAIFDRETTERILAAGDPNRPFLFVDLAIPRDVSDDVSGIANVHVCHLGTLRDLSMKNRRERFVAADRAREIIGEEVGRFHKDVVEVTLAPLFDETQKQADEFACAGLEGLFAGKLAHLKEADKEAIRYWVMNKLVPQVLHMPVKRIADYAGPQHWCSAEQKDCSGGIRVHGLRLAPPKC